MKGKRKIIILINPVSGIGRKGIIGDKINELIDMDRFDHEIIYTKYKGHAVEISKQAANEKVDAVIAVGGDGSINEVVRGIVNSDTALGIIPRGSGNGLARTLKIPFSTSGAMDVINNFNKKSIDTGSVNDHVFINVAGVGFDGLVAEKFAENSQRGFLGYLRIVTLEYTSYVPKKYTLEIDGTHVESDALFVSFANSQQFGYNTVIAPKAALDDGLLDVCIVQKPPLIEIPLLARMMYLKRIDESKYVKTYKAKSIILKREQDIAVNIDGEPVKTVKELLIQVNPSSLKVIVP